MASHMETFSFDDVIMMDGKLVVQVQMSVLVKKFYQTFAEFQSSDKHQILGVGSN